MTESLLAYFHILALLTTVVFIGASTALCRSEWLNRAAVQRLVRVDTLYWIGLLTVLLTGLARLFWGIKEPLWYFQQPFFHLKLTLIVAIAALSLRPSLALRRWQSDTQLPSVNAINRVRRQMMVSAHVMVVVPLLAVLVARGLSW